MTMTRPTNTDDVIDSRDVIEAIEELESELEMEEGVISADCPLDEEDLAELAELRALAEEAEGYSGDWPHGAALIRDSYFEDYAQQLAEDTGAIPNNDWPLYCIDWECAARNLQMDYTRVDFDGVEYWIR